MSPTTTIERGNAQNELFSRSEVERILSNMLKSKTSGLLLEYEVVPECGPTGYLGEYFHLQLKYRTAESSNTQTTRLFVKTLPYQNPKMTAFIEACGMLTKEAAIYERLLNELRKLTTTIWCAECYFTRRDLFVMQNIVDMGYEPVQEPAEFLTESQMNVLLKSLATMHACSIVYEERNRLSIGEELNDVLREMTVTPDVVFYTAGVRAILAVVRVHPAYQCEVMQKFIADELPRQLDSVYEMVNPSRKYRNVFCHRDLWGGNFFFNKSQPDKQPVVLVDYQLARYSPPAIDVLMTIYLNITPQQRGAMKQQCYETYYNYFAAELKQQGLDAAQQLSRSEFVQSLQALELFGALYNCISATILRVPGDYLKNLKLNHPDAFHRYTNVDRVKEVLELLKIDRKFREYIFECIDEMMHLLL
uniref:CHK kinase-like domain-containing protein n=1 Tax=Ceratitis capitata TaxID=7213 RepID=W8C7X0_CERCA